MNFIKNSLNTILVCHALVFILCVVDNQNTYKWQLPGGSKYYQKEPLFFSGNFNVNERIFFSSLPSYMYVYMPIFLQKKM